MRLLSIHPATGAYKSQGKAALICLGRNFVPESGGIFPAKIQRRRINQPTPTDLYAPSKKTTPAEAYKPRNSPSFICPRQNTTPAEAYKNQHTPQFIRPQEIAKKREAYKNHLSPQFIRPEERTNPHKAYKSNHTRGFIRPPTKTPEKETTIALNKSSTVKSRQKPLHRQIGFDIYADKN